MRKIHELYTRNLSIPNESLFGEPCGQVAQLDLTSLKMLNEEDVTVNGYPCGGINEFLLHELININLQDMNMNRMSQCLQLHN